MARRSSASSQGKAARAGYSFVGGDFPQVGKGKRKPGIFRFTRHSLVT
jgi:hypothetical protein